MLLFVVGFVYLCSLDLLPYEKIILHYINSASVLGCGSG